MFNYKQIIGQGFQQPHCWGKWKWKNQQRILHQPNLTTYFSIARALGFHVCLFSTFICKEDGSLRVLMTIWINLQFPFSCQYRKLDHAAFVCKARYQNSGLFFFLNKAQFLILDETKKCRLFTIMIRYKMLATEQKKRGRCTHKSMSLHLTINYNLSSLIKSIISS